MATLQVKGMDDALYRALAARAASENRSISQEVVTILQEYLSQPASHRAPNDDVIRALAGSWNDDRSADEIVDEIRRNRRSSKRFDKNRVFD